jgi:methanogenic corrinoid protein MtbC1
MTDGQDNRTGKGIERAGTSVADLASRAIAVLAERRGDRDVPLSERLLDMLIKAAMNRDDEALTGVVTDMVHSGISEHEIVSLYVPEAARWLGQQWCDDGLGFAEVTIGCARLQQVVRKLSPEPRRSRIVGGSSDVSVLVVVMPNEHHTLGAVVLASQFRLMGVSVRLVLGEDKPSILRAMTSEDYDGIFFSTSSEERLDELRGFIDKSRNVLSRSMPIVVGGAATQQGLDLKRLTGADHACSDAKEALEVCGLKVEENAVQRLTTV